MYDKNCFNLGVENEPLSPLVDLEFDVPETLEFEMEHSDSLLTSVVPLTSEDVGEWMM